MYYIFCIFIYCRIFCAYFCSACSAGAAATATAVSDPAAITASCREHKIVFVHITTINTSHIFRCITASDISMSIPCRDTR